MKIADYLLLALVCVGMLLALTAHRRKRKKGCTYCGGCSSCRGCAKAKS